MNDELNLHAIVTRLVGPIDPVGESHTDDKRFDNLKTLTDLIDRLLGDIERVSSNKSRHEYSMKRAGEHCIEFFDSVGLIK